MMKKAEIQSMIDTLLHELEEEDISISLFSTFYQNESELVFFSEMDRLRIREILTRLAEDSHRHKMILEDIITELGLKLL